MEDQILNVKILATVDTKKMFRCMQNFTRYGQICLNFILNENKIMVSIDESTINVDDIIIEFYFAGEQIRFLKCDKEKISIRIE